jgi:hypothetical protein
MLGIKYNKGNVKRRITLVLVVMCLIMYTIDAQLYIEQRILANVATCTGKFDKFNRKQDYFHMSLQELMDVVVASDPEDKSSSHLFDFSSYPSDSIPKRT